MLRALLETCDPVCDKGRAMDDTLAFMSKIHSDTLLYLFCNFCVYL